MTKPKPRPGKRKPRKLSSAVANAITYKRLTSGGRKNRTLSLKVGSYTAFKRHCKADEITVSEMVDNLIISYMLEVSL